MDAERKEHCGVRIRKALAFRGMKQSELCQLTNIPKSALSQYISGCFEPKQDRIFLIAKALDVSEAWLMGYDVPMERNATATQNEQELSDGEKLMLELFNKVPEDKQALVIEMIRAALKTRE